MLLFLQNFIKFSSTCASPSYVAIVYIVMRRNICFLDFFLSRSCEALYSIPIFFDILFSTSCICLFQVIFSSIITPRNLTEDSRLISILLKVIVGNFNGMLSHALGL